MRRALFATLVFTSVIIAGCIGPSAPEWGKTSSGLHASLDSSTKNATVVPMTSSTAIEFETYGCQQGETAPVTEGGSPIKFEGYLASSVMYQTHDTSLVGSQDDLMVAMAVAIEDMSIDQASQVADGEGARIDLKSWTDPRNPDTGSGSVDLDELNSDSKTSWYILGLVPTSENLMNGLLALTEWHQGIEIEGYIGIPSRGQLGEPELRTDCSLKIGSDNSARYYVFVTKINLENDIVISSNGESDNEWTHGDVAFLGRGGYISAFLFVGIGGAVGSFIFSKTLIIRDAKQQMKILVGEEGMSKVAKVKDDMKMAKKAGMESPEERLKKQRKEAQEKAKLEQRESSTILPSEGDSDELGGFDLDSVLASAGKPSSTPGPGSQKQAKKSTSAVTAEMTSVGSSSEQKTTEPAAQPKPVSYTHLTLPTICSV